MNGTSLRKWELGVFGGTVKKTINYLSARQYRTDAKWLDWKEIVTLFYIRSQRLTKKNIGLLANEKYKRYSVSSLSM